MIKVFLADDEVLERQALKIIISENFEKATVIGESESGIKTIELVKKLNPDIVLMDIKMPGINGIEASRSIKEYRKNIKIIILTAYDDYDLINKATMANVDDYILKPAKPEKIVETINKYVKEINVLDEIINNSLKELLYNLKTERYRESKKVLKSIIQNFLLSCDDTEEIKLNVEKIIFEIHKVAREKGINEIKDLDHDFIQKNNDVFDIQNYLESFIDKIFDKIMKSRDYKDRNNDIKILLNYIEKNFQNGLTLKEVADYMNFSPYYLSKLFKNEMGINFIEYITIRKIEKAKELLENTDMPILNIALDLSYNEPNYFSRVFKKIVGMTPTEYRYKKKAEKAQKLKNNLLSRHVFLSNTRWYV